MQTASGILTAEFTNPTTERQEGTAGSTSTPPQPVGLSSDLIREAYFPIFGFFVTLDVFANHFHRYFVADRFGDSDSRIVVVTYNSSRSTLKEGVDKLFRPVLQSAAARE